MKKVYITLIVAVLLGTTYSVSAQQDPQFTQYMYNTQIINPAYAGSREAISIGGLYRTQWVGLDGAPDTGTLTVHSPIGMGNVGLGVSIVREEIGIIEETYANIDFSYTIQTSDVGKLAFGIKAGVNLFNLNFTELTVANPGDIFDNDIDNKIKPQIGAGAYYYTDKFYAGLSVPNFIESSYFDTADIENFQGSGDIISKERLHYFFITGYVFDLSDDVKFKPALLTKLVTGSPLQADVSANFMFYDKFTLGAAYRWSAALSAMVAFQVTDELMLGFAYDRETTDLTKFNDGSFEFYLRYEIFKQKERILSPRFF